VRLLRRWRGLPAAVAAASLLAACASVPVGRVIKLEPAATAAFDVEGRLSARRGSEGVAVGFTWRHDPPRDRLTIATPLGQVLAELEGDDDAQRVALTLADGRSAEAPDWPALTERALGFALPVGALSAWVRGLPHAHSAYDAEGDATGRVASLRQDGWAIDFTYPDAESLRPTRLRLSDQDIEVRIVIDRWR
jgi:outer membrane lipoprotein LolB